MSLINISFALEVIILENIEENTLNSILKEIIQSHQNPSSSLIDWHICTYLSIYECLEKYPNSSVLLDLSKDLNIQLSMSQLCDQNKIIHLVAQEDFKYYDDWTYSIISSKNSRLNAFFAVLEYFKWSKGIIFINKFDENKFTNFTTNFDIVTIESMTNIENLIMRYVPPLGLTLYYIFTDSTESLLIQHFLEEANLLTSGSGILLDHKSGYNCTSEGALIITGLGYEIAISEEQYIKNSILNILTEIAKKAENPIEALYLLKNQTSSHYLQNNFSIINIQNGERIIIGSIIEGKVTLVNDTIFPGKTKTIPKSDKKILNLSIDAGTTNPNYSPSTIAALGARGSYIALDLINNGKSGMLSNFHVQLLNYDCGASLFNLTFATACFKKDIDKFGLGHIVSYTSSVTIGTMKLFKSLNLTFPMAGINSDPSLNSTKIYPWYQRVWPSTSFTLPLIPILLRALGWTQAAVLYQNDSWGQNGYYFLKIGAENHNMSFINPENTRAMPTGLDRNTIKNHSDIIQGVINSQARLVVFIIQVPLVHYVIESFYDLGMRKGDIIIFTSTVPDILTSILVNDDYLYKRIEIGVPMITFLGQQWVGDLGKSVLSRYYEMYPNTTPSAYVCNYFDAIYLITHAIDFMIDRGQNYTDPYKLENVVRNTQFSGCTGHFLIEKGSNDKLISVLDVRGSKYDIDKNVVNYLIGELKPYSTSILELKNPIIYPDGTTNKPSDFRNENYDCPFPDKEIRTFAKGKFLVFGICFTIAAISIIITFIIWKRWWNIPIEDLRERKEISFQDFIVIITIFIEFFQFASMGPSMSYLSTILEQFSSSMTLELTNIVKLKNGVFWIVIDIVFGSIALWFCMCMVVLFRLDEKYSQFWIFRFIAWLADYLMPILGNLCFIPFVSICLDIFVCDKSIGENFTDSFLSYDCYYFCWKDEHLIYAILSIFALLCYEPLAVFCRPLWQELQIMLHVKAIPLFLMVKTIVQVTLIVMNKTVKRAQDITHGVLFVVVMMVYISFLFKFKPYNYERFNLWQNLSLIGVVWLAFLSTIALGAKGNSIILTIILCCGWVFIIFIGLYIQRKKCPSLLFRPKGQDTSTLFKFAFTFGKNSRKALTKIIPSSLGSGGVSLSRKQISS